MQRDANARSGLCLPHPHTSSKLHPGKKVLGRASDFFLSAEKSLQLGLCARPLANTNAHQNSECEVSFVEVLFTSTNPLHKVIWFA